MDVNDLLNVRIGKRGSALHFSARLCYRHRGSWTCVNDRRRSSHFVPLRQKTQEACLIHDWQLGLLRPVHQHSVQSFQLSTVWPRVTWNISLTILRSCCWKSFHRFRWRVSRHLTRSIGLYICLWLFSSFNDLQKLAVTTVRHELLTPVFFTYCKTSLVILIFVQYDLACAIIKLHSIETVYL